MHNKVIVAGLSVLIACLCLVVTFLTLGLFRTPGSPTDQIGAPGRTPSITLRVNPTSITLGQSASLTWTVTRATSCTATGGWSGGQPLQGSLSVSPTANTTYILTCVNGTRTASRSVTLFVDSTGSTQPPILNFGANPTEGIDPGESSVLVWTATNAATCTASGAWSGTKNVVGSFDIFPQTTSTYTLTCSNIAGAQITRSTTVTVNGTTPPPPPPAAQCADSIDNDGDSLTDFPADPGCTSATDNDEFNAPPTSGNVMQPGNGFTGPTPVPAPRGTSSQQGFDAIPIAHWETVPYQTFSTTLNVGVLAYHFNDIAYVDFSANGGPWTRITSATENPQTGVSEYWAVLRASDFQNDGPVEVRAIVYPVIGQVKVLQGNISGPSSSFFANSNSGGTMPRPIRYVKTAAQGGNDNNTCLSTTQSCATIRRALISAADSTRSVDGLEIRLGAGDWQLPQVDGTIWGGAWWQEGYFTNHQYVTFTPVTGLDSDDVFITGVDGSSDSAGIGLKKLHFKNVSVVGNINKASGQNSGSYIWFNNTKMFYRQPDAVFTAAPCQGGFHGYDRWTGAFYTDVWMDNVCDGPRGAVLARNVHVERSGGGHASGAKTVVNYTVKTIYGSGYPFPWGTGPDYHGDLYQFGYGSLGNTIIYGMRTIPGGFISSRGIAGSMPEGNVAIVNTNIDTRPIWVFSTCSPINHLVIKNSTFWGSSSPWCGEGSGTVNQSQMRNILIENSVWENGTAERLPLPWNMPGIRYIPAR